MKTGPHSSQPCLFLRVESLLLEQAEEINLLVLLLLLLLLFSLLLSLMLSLLLLSFTSRSCLFLRIESALLEQVEDIVLLWLLSLMLLLLLLLLSSSDQRYLGGDGGGRPLWGTVSPLLRGDAWRHRGGGRFLLLCYFY